MKPKKKTTEELLIELSYEETVLETLTFNKKYECQPNYLPSLS